MRLSEAEILDFTCESKKGCAMELNKPLREVLATNPDVKLSPGQLDELFSLQRALRNTDLVFKEVTQIQF